MSVLLFAGAGTSIELGVPGMAGLAKEFLRHVTQWNVEAPLVAKLMGDTSDLEYLVERVDNVCGAKGEIEIGIDSDLISRAERIRGEVEWFVQYSAERIAPTDAQLMWGPTLRAATARGIALATTNYDRAIEIAANAEGIRVSDGFDECGVTGIGRWKGFEDDGASVPLIKLHGSTDWYTDRRSDDPVRLRHPMPLFGDASLIFGGSELGSALVLPSREKILTANPYPRLSQKFLNMADQCDGAIFVGTSLRDNHIRGAAQSLASRVPVILVNPDAASVNVIAGGVMIQQGASEFLMSTLPNALYVSGSGDIVTNVMDALSQSTDGASVHGGGILVEARLAMDSKADALERCQAIDAIIAVGAMLPVESILRILEGADTDVARYALGLVLRLSRREELIVAAETSVHTNDDRFRDELELLRKLVSEN